MDEKIKKLLNGLDYQDLLSLKKDLNSGGFMFKHILNFKLNELETKDRDDCASCNKKLNKEREEIFTLLFGKNIKKKASFCGMDCLNEFMTNLKRDKEEILRKELQSAILDNELNNQNF